MIQTKIQPQRAGDGLKRLTFRIDDLPPATHF